MPTYKKLYKPQNPHKYQGNPTTIINRSSWETVFCKFCDGKSNVLQWSSEELAIPYRCATDNKIHRYFVDFKMVVREKDGSINTYLVEIKPSKQTEQPKYPGRTTKKYLTESLTYAKNMSKWKAASQYAKQRGWKFIIITEKDLNLDVPKGKTNGNSRKLSKSNKQI